MTNLPDEKKCIPALTVGSTRPATSAAERRRKSRLGELEETNKKRLEFIDVTNALQKAADDLMTKIDKQELPIDPYHAKIRKIAIAFKEGAADLKRKIDEVEEKCAPKLEAKPVSHTSQQEGQEIKAAGRRLEQEVREARATLFRWVCLASLLLVLLLTILFRIRDGIN
jgi:hypothetical protein